MTKSGTTPARGFESLSGNRNVACKIPATAQPFILTKSIFMKQSLLPFFCLLFLAPLGAQDIEDPSLRKPYRCVVQTGVALQWFDTQFKSFTFSVERPLNLYNHFGVQANFFFPNDEGGYYYRTITGKSWEAGVFAKCFFHGRLTGRRSKTYVGPDMRIGQRYYLNTSDTQLIERKASTVKIMARLGWQYHLGLAVFEFAFPFGLETEKFKDDLTATYPYYYLTDATWFVAAPTLSIGIGF